MRAAVSPSGFAIVTSTVPTGTACRRSRIATRFGTPPFAPVTHSASNPRSLLSTYAIREPSGDQAGMNASAVPKVIGTGSPPDAGSTAIALRPRRNETYAIREPSGENTGRA
jgi:hypothetical protein